MSDPEAGRLIVLFDLDLTLLSIRADREIRGRAIDRATGTSGALDLVDDRGRTDRWLVDEIVRRGIAAEDGLWDRYEAEYTSELARALAATPQSALPGAAELLTALRATSAVLGVSTGNLRANAEAKLAHAQLTRSSRPSEADSATATRTAPISCAWVPRLAGMREAPASSSSATRSMTCVRPSTPVRYQSPSRPATPTARNCPRPEQELSSPTSSTPPLRSLPCADHTKLVYTRLVYTACMKNITLSADEQDIEAARERARAEQTTVNEQFRRWLRQYGRSQRSADEIRARLEEYAQGVDVGQKFTRDEMNER